MTNSALDSLFNFCRHSVKVATVFLITGMISTGIVQAATATWSATATNGNWEATTGETNWSTGDGTFPGSTTTTNSADIAYFMSSATTNIFINATAGNTSPVNVSSIIFGASGSAPSSFTLGTTSGNALWISNGGIIQLASGIAGSNITERINAPIVIEPASATTAGGATIRNDSTTASNVMIVNGAVSGGATSGTITFTLRGGNSGANTVNGLISNGGATTFAVTKSDGATWILTNRANSYNGATTVTGGVLQAQDSFTYASGNQTLVGGGAMGTGQVVINGGTLQLRINGDNTSAAQTLTYQNSSLFVNNSLTSTIDMDRMSDSTTAQNKTLAFAAAAVARGGKLSVTGSNGYQLQLNNFTLTGSGDGSYTLNPTSANLALTGTVQNNTNATTGTIILDGTSTGNTVTANVINGVGTGRVLAITKSNTGKWTFSGANTYTGNTAVNAGVLLVNGTHNAGTGAYSVAGGGTLGGTGTITASGLVAAAGGKLSPGGDGVTSNFTFSLTGNMDLTASSDNSGGYLFDLSTVNASDRIVLAAGTLNIGTLDFSDFTFTALTGFGGGTYILFDAASAITGSIGTATGTINGFDATLSLDSTNNDILLTVVPEASTTNLLAMTLLGFLGAVLIRRTKAAQLL